MKVPEPITLKGRYVRLEPLEGRHLPGLIAAGDEDPEIFRYMVGSPYIIGWEEWFAEAVAGPDHPLVSMDGRDLPVRLGGT